MSETKNHNLDDRLVGSRCRRMNDTHKSTSEVVVDENLVFKVERMLKKLQKESQQNTQEQILLATICALQRQFDPKLVNENLIRLLNSKPTAFLHPKLNDDTVIVPPTTITIPTTEEAAAETSFSIQKTPTKRKPVRAYLDGW